jgi:hypothetical protein
MGYQSQCDLRQSWLSTLTDDLDIVARMEHGDLVMRYYKAADSQSSQIYQLYRVSGKWVGVEASESFLSGPRLLRGSFRRELAPTLRADVNAYLLDCRTHLAHG